jgi:hypothetical protein
VTNHVFDFFRPVSQNWKMDQLQFNTQDKIVDPSGEGWGIWTRLRVLDQRKKGQSNLFLLIKGAPLSKNEIKWLENKLKP